MIVAAAELIKLYFM